jgi:simple sugar transport system permease protein
MRATIEAPMIRPATSIYQFIPLKSLESLTITAGAVGVSLLIFGLFVLISGYNPLDAYRALWIGSFGSKFSLQNSLSKAAPLMLTGLCVALPLRLGMVIIGGEGALVLGGLAAAYIGHAMDGANAFLVITLMFAGGMAVGAIWIALAGMLRIYRGVNETISSLLLFYIAKMLFQHLVEGPLKDPGFDLVQSTHALAPAYLIGDALGNGLSGDSWGLIIGIAACVGCYILMNHSVLGFAANVVGGNVRAARIAGISVSRMSILICLIAGACAGLTGVIQVMTVEPRANAHLFAFYGFSGILVAFLARGNPLAIIPVTILLGGISASGGVFQRNVLPFHKGKAMDSSSVEVLKGIIFLTILASESFYGRLKLFQRKEA